MNLLMEVTGNVLVIVSCFVIGALSIISDAPSLLLASGLLVATSVRPVLDRLGAQTNTP